MLRSFQSYERQQRSLPLSGLWQRVTTMNRVTKLKNISGPESTPTKLHTHGGDDTRTLTVPFLNYDYCRLCDIAHLTTVN